MSDIEPLPDGLDTRLHSLFYAQCKGITFWLSIIDALTSTLDSRHAWVITSHCFNKKLILIHILIVPETSAYLCHDAFGILQWDITSRPLESDVILCGDYNAHTNVAVDFVIDELEGSNGDLDSLIPNDSKESLEIIFDMYSKKQLGRYLGMIKVSEDSPGLIPPDLV